MDPVARGNVLTHPRSRALEYAIHGKWRRTEDDVKGVDGCWYIGVPELVQTFGAAAVRAKLAEFAAAQAAAREDAIAAAEERPEAEGQGGEEGS